MDLQNDAHRRFNPLTGEWILVSPHRTKRPWQGKTEDTVQDTRPDYEPSCYLCPGNTRAGGEKNPKYTSTYTFTNDFAALIPDVPLETVSDGLLVAAGEQGKCKVICFSPRHDLTLPLMSQGEIEGVIDAWSREYEDLGQEQYINHVQIFENKGAIMGCSNPHPHGQIWCNSTVPDLPAKETDRQADYHREQGECMLCAYARQEMAAKERIVEENNTFITVVPFWATWPFEIMILPKRHIGSILELNNNETADFAGILQASTVRLDNLFTTSFPYSMGIHQKPTDGSTYEAWHMHLHFYPPLLRSATVKKFMVGYEMLGAPQRDITAEMSAQRLRDLDSVHYLTT